MRKDGDIKRDAESGLRWDPKLAREAIAVLNLALPSLNINVVVDKNGILSLEGKVQWHWQSGRAEEVVRAVGGAREVSNLIVVTG